MFSSLALRFCPSHPQLLYTGVVVVVVVICLCCLVVLQGSRPALRCFFYILLCTSIYYIYVGLAYVQIACAR